MKNHRRFSAILFCMALIALILFAVPAFAVLEHAKDMTWAGTADLQEVKATLKDYQKYLLPLDAHDKYKYQVFRVFSGKGNQGNPNGYDRRCRYFISTQIHSPYVPNSDDAWQSVLYTRVDLILPDLPAIDGSSMGTGVIYYVSTDSVELDKIKMNYGKNVREADHVTSLAGFPAKGYAGILYDYKTGKQKWYEMDVYVDLKTFLPWAQNSKDGKSIIHFKIRSSLKDASIAEAQKLAKIINNWKPSLSEPVVIGVDRDLLQSKSPEPIVQNETVTASSTEGEDEGTEIKPGIIGNVFGTLGAIVGAGLLGLAAGKAIDDSQKKKKRYKMLINKNFGDTLSAGSAPQAVFARIVEIDENGVQTDCPELTAHIQVFSSDSSLEIGDGGMVQNYRCAMASVPETSENSTGVGTVSFRFVGEGGVFTQNVQFNINQPAIIFGQENIGVPANKNEEFRVPFGIRGMSDNVRVTYEFKKLGVADVGNNKLSVKEEGNALALRIEPDKEHPRVFEAVITECSHSEYPAGTTEAYKLTVIAEEGVINTPGYRKIKQDFPVFRIHLGLTLLVSTNSIGCYLQLRPERVGVKNPKPSDYEYCVTEGSLLLLDYDQKSQSILRIAPVPKIPDANTGEPGSTKVYAKKLLADRYAHKSEATKEHQTLVDKLGIVAFPTTDIHNTGGRKIKICSTKGGLDAPTRLNADIEISIIYNGKKYTVKREVLLRSQPFIDFDKVDRYTFQKQQAEIRERLLHIQENIMNRKYLRHLYSLYDLIDRMTDGYDEKFGFDQNQVDNVMEIWTGFLEGTHTGANGETEPVTLADELKACYAFMEGMRDNSILGRIALGVCTGGYSEVMFTAMTVSDEIKELIYTTKPGETELGFWDAVSIGVREYGKQYVIEASLMATGLSANYLLKNTTGFDAMATAANCAQKYQNFVNNADRSLCASSKLYKAGADMLEKGQNYFSTLARSSKNALDKSAEALERSAAEAKKTSAATKAKMQPGDFKDFEGAMQSGRIKVDKLKAAQQKLARSSGAEKAAARAEYEQLVQEVWRDKNALTQLQRSNDPYAANMRAEYNRYRDRILENARTKALDDISAETGIPREDLYNFNATGKKKKLATEHIPNDSDESVMVMVRSDRSKDFTVDQNVAENAIARNFYKEMTGMEPADIGAAKKFLEEYDVSVVSEFKSSHDAFVIERHPEAYRDLKHMVGIKQDGSIDKALQAKALNGLVLNQKTVSYKGREWYTNRANESLSNAAKCEKEAQALSGMMREAKLAEAQGYRYQCQACKREGIRQIVKQTDEIIIPRDNYSVARGNQSKLSQQMLDLNASAKRVVDGIDAPAVFERTLKDCGLTLESWGDFVSKCLS